MLGHHAMSKAPLTSRLVIITTFLFSNFEAMNFFASIAASVVLFCGVNPFYQHFIFVQVVVNSVNEEFL